MKKKTITWLILLLALTGALVLGFYLGSRGTAPLAVFRHYPVSLLSLEASTMAECVECHEPQDFHTCDTCHDDHGAIELTEVPFYNLVLLTGDVPKPGFVEVNQVLPYRDHPNTMVSVRDFLLSQGVESFEKVIFSSLDGGVVAIDQSELSDLAYFMPYMDGIRFVCEDLHVSTWLKGIRQIIVVGSEKNLVINGVPTSLGRLLEGPTQSMTVESANTMFVSESDGKTRKAVTAMQVQGVMLADVMDLASTTEIKVMDQKGETHLVPIEQAKTGLLLPVQGVLTLVFPERGRAQWISGVVAIENSN